MLIALVVCGTPFEVTEDATAVSPFLAEQRLSSTAFLGSPRFVPRSTKEALTAIFAQWNMLDALMYIHTRNNFATGYLRELQVRRMVQLVRSPHVKTYCEVCDRGQRVTLPIRSPTLAAALCTPILRAPKFPLVVLRGMVQPRAGWHEWRSFARRHVDSKC